MSTDDPLQQVQAIWAAFAAGGLDGLLSHCDDDVEWAPDVAGGGILHGSEELRAPSSPSGERSANGCEPTMYASSATATWSWPPARCASCGPGTATESQLAWVFQFQDGRLRSAISYPTRADALRAVAVPLA